ncbi:MAG: VanZ family protein [Lachnospiraceae bacterium]|nr:VanZ family protein [Lachnospiraceae bacterium]
MNIWFESIYNGIEICIRVLPVMIIFSALVIGIKGGNVSPLRLIGVQASVLYLICLVSVVFFPLPSAEQVAAMHGYKGQYIPFKFVLDIAREKSLRSVLQVIFNIFMTIPFGLILRYCLGIKRRNIVILTFLLSLLIELAQLTGLFFLYPGSYRLFDVDDLMLNTLGGFLGVVIADRIPRPTAAAFRFSFFPGSLRRL